MLQWLKVISVLITGALGILGAVTDARGSDGRLTRGGKALLFAVFLTTMIAVLLVQLENREQQIKDDVARHQLQSEIVRQKEMLARLRELLQQQQAAVALTTQNLQTTKAVAAGVAQNVVKTGEVQDRVTANLDETRSVSSGVAKLLRPFRISAVQLQLAHPLDNEWFTDFKRRVDQVRALAPDQRAIREHDVFTRYEDGEPVGLDIPDGSAFFPQERDGPVAGSLRRAVFLLAFYRQRPNQEMMSGAAGDLLLDCDVEFDDAKTPEQQYPGRALRYANANHLYVDYGRNMAVQTILCVEPRVRRNSYKIDTYSDLVGGGIRVVVPVVFVPKQGYQPRFLRLRIYPDKSLTSFYDIPSSRVRPDSTQGGAFWFQPEQADMLPTTYDPFFDQPRKPGGA